MRAFVVLVESVLLAAALLLLAESLGWRVVSQAGGTTAKGLTYGE